MKKFYELMVHKSLKGTERQTAELLARFAIRAFLASLLAWPLVASLDVMAESALMTTTIVLGCSLIASRFTKNTTLNGYIILGSVYYAIASISMATGGVNTSFIFLVALVPLGAAMTIGGKHGRIHSFIACFVAIGIGLFTIVTLPESPLNDYANFILSIIICVSLILFSISITRQFQKMKDDAFEEIAERKKAMERIINNVQSGFVIIDREYKIQPGYSISSETLLNKEDLAGSCLAQLVESDKRLVEHVQSCWDQVFEDFMPEEVTMGQSPSKFMMSCGRWLGIDGKAIRTADGTVFGILFTIVDITKQVHAEKENEKNKQVLQVLKNKDGFFDMVRESKASLEALRSGVENHNSEWVMRVLHTMKGNTASFGMVELAKCIHEIESAKRFSSEEWNQIESQFDKYFEENQEVFQVSSMKDIQSFTFRVPETRIEDLAEVTRTAMDSPFKSLVQDWVQQVQTIDIKFFLQVMEGQLNRISQDIGKPAELSIESNDVRIGRHFSKFVQHLPNMFRNSLYHGIEEEYERGDKPWPPVLTLRATEGPLGVRLEVIDDGQGINVDALRKKLKEQSSSIKVEEMTDHEVIQGLFSDGVSTAESVNEIAGRGAGTSAVKADVESMGGKIEVFSEPGKGTRFVVDLPQVIFKDRDNDVAA